MPISNNPVEQTTFQALEDEERENIIVKIIDELKEKDCDAIFVYCNSLSSVVDFDRLAEKMDISIITPMQMYRNLGLEYKYLAVMAAELSWSYRCREQSLCIESASTCAWIIDVGAC